MEDKIVAFLETLHANVDFRAEESLVENGIIDSLDIVAIMHFVEDEFDFTFTEETLTVENLNSAKAIANLVDEGFEARGR